MGWYSRSRIEQTLRQVLRQVLGRAGGDGNGKLGSFRLWLGLEEKEQRSSLDRKVLWTLSGEGLRTPKSKGSSLLPQL